MHFIFKVSLSVSAASQSKLGALDLDWVYSTAWPWALIETGLTPDDYLPRGVYYPEFCGTTAFHDRESGGTILSGHGWPVDGQRHHMFGNLILLHL